MGNNSVTVRGKGAGNDQAERTVYFGKQTSRSIWKYVASRLKNPHGPLFLDRRDDRPITRNTLWQMLNELGERAGVKGVHSHRFRHTFGRSFGRLVNASEDATREQTRVFSPWRFSVPRHTGLVSFQGT